MKRLSLFLLAFLLLAPWAFAQTLPVPDASKPPAPASKSASTSETQTSIDRLTKSNQELLDLLNKQQAVLVDIQFDRRMQSRQIQNLEERLQEALMQNVQLQSKITALENAAAVSAANPPVANPQAGAITGVSTPPKPPSTPVADTPPSPPASYLPQPEAEGAPGTKSWHRLFTLKGDDIKTSDIFHIQGRQWRVLWHNQDKPGKGYENTSGLFVNAFPKDDTIPQRVCSKVGSGGDSTELIGPGNYYLKIDASGGSWELAVEDFR